MILIKTVVGLYEKARKLICNIVSHKITKREYFSSEWDKVFCGRCNQWYAMNKENKRAFVKWDDELEELHN